MEIFLGIFMIVMMFAVLASIGPDGVWHNLLTMFSVLISAIVATNYFEPVALQLDLMMPSFSYVFDFLALWGLFSGSMVCLWLLTSQISGVRVIFENKIDQIGGFVLSVFTGWILVCFTMMTLHTAPLARSSFGGGFQPTPEAKMVFSLAPDHRWLALMHGLSRGESFGQGDSDEPAFDPDGTFILKYAERRNQYEAEPGLRVEREWGKPGAEVLLKEASAK